MKSLKIIQVFSKIGKILSRIIYISSIIGAIGCSVGIISLIFSDAYILKLEGITLYSLIDNLKGIELKSLYPIMTGAMIFCIGEAVNAKFAEFYFMHELSSGTPFTKNGAKELFRLGILTIAISLGTLISAKIVSSIIVQMIGYGEEFNLDGGDSVAIGIMFIIMSFLCRYGAEIQENGKNDF